MDLLDGQLGAKAGARNSASDMAMLRAAHDALVLCGAQCVEPAPDDDGSSEGANRAVESAMVGAKASALRARLGCLA